MKTLRVFTDDVNSIFYPPVTASISQPLPLPSSMADVPKGPGPHAEFGEWIREKRRCAKNRTQPKAVLAARRLGLHLITQGKLTHLERGWNRNPDPELLRQVATLFQVPYEEVVAHWVAHRFGTTTSAGAPLASHSRHAVAEEAALMGGSDESDETQARTKSEDDDIQKGLSELQALTDIVSSLESAEDSIRRARLALTERRAPDPRDPSPKLGQSDPYLRPKPNRQTRRRRRL